MPTATYTPLANVTLGTAVSSVTFSSIPATYRDLIVVVDGALTGAGGFGLRLNGDTGANYPQVMMRGESTANSGNDATATSFYGSWSTVQTVHRYKGMWNIMDYSATDKHKTVLLRTGYALPTITSVEAHAGRWANTSAITSLGFFTSANQFAATTRIDLYGVIA
jgi:hypothetical protein